MKIKDLNTSEPYTRISSRAKLCLEAEQRRKIGGWIDRVLVIDKATLYTYRTRGDSGSLNAWVIGGSEVGARKPRKDGRYIVTIVRRDAYSLMFALNTVDEQAAFIHALSSSGATIVGIYGILMIDEYTKIQTAIKVSLEEQRHCCDQHVVYRKNSKNRAYQKRMLEMPELSSRMTAMSWTFGNPDRESHPDVVSENVSKNDANLSDEMSENPYLKLSPQTSLELKTREEKRTSNIPDVDSPTQNTESTMDRVDYVSKSNKEPLKRFSYIDTLESKTRDKGTSKGGLNLEKSENSRHSEMAKVSQNLPKSEIIPISEETGKVWQMRHVFESKTNEPKNSQKTTQMITTNQKYQNELVKKCSFGDTSHSKFLQQDIKKSSKDSLHLQRYYKIDDQNSSEEHFHTRDNVNELIRDKAAETTNNFEDKENRTEWTSHSKRQGQNSDERKMTSELNTEHDSGVILSDIMRVAESPGGESVLTRVELMRGQLLLFAINQQQQKEMTANRPLEDPKSISSQSVIRLNLEGVSTVPFFERGCNSVILKRKHKSLVVLQLESHEEMMTWVRALSDEIMTVTPLTKRGSLVVYPTSSSLEESLPSETSTRKEKKYSWSKNTAGNEPQQMNGSTSRVDELSNPQLLIDYKFPKETEKNPDSLFKGLRRKMGIRRASRDMDKMPVVRHTEQYFDQVQETSEENYDEVESVQTGQFSKNASTKVLEDKDASHKKLTFTTKVYLNVSESFSDDVQDDKMFRRHSGVNKINGTFPEPPLGSECDFGYKTKMKNNFSDISKSFPKEKKDYQREAHHENNDVTISGRDNSQRSKDASLKFERFGNVPKTCVQDMIKNYNAFSTNTESSYKFRRSLPNITSTTKNEVRKRSEQNLALFPTSEDGKEPERYKRETFLIEKTLYVGGVGNYTRGKLARSSTETEEDADKRKSASTKDIENGNCEENDSLNVTWSVAALKERYEILNTVNGKKDHMGKHSWNQNSINKRKEKRNSIRRKKAFEGESRRASIRRSTRRNKTATTQMPRNENSEAENQKLRISNEAKENQTSKVNSSNENNKADFSLDSNITGIAPSTTLAAIKLPFNRNVKTQIPQIRISAAEEDKHWGRANSLNEDTQMDRKSYLTLDSNRFTRSYSFNSHRSVIVAKNRRLKSLKPSSSLRSERLPAGKKKSFLNSKPSNDPFQILPGVVMKDDNEGSVYENLNNTFLAKRCLVSKEIEVARIQDAMVHQEEEICKLQLKINSLSTPNFSQFRGKSRAAVEEIQLLKKLEQELITAKTQYDILEDRLNEVKHKTNIVKQQMETSIRKCLEQ